MIDEEWLKSNELQFVVYKDSKTSYSIYSIQKCFCVAPSVIKEFLNTKGSDIIPQNIAKKKSKRLYLFYTQQTTENKLYVKHVEDVTDCISSFLHIKQE